VVCIGIDAWNGSASAVQSFTMSTDPDLTYTMLLKGSSVASDYGTANDYYMVIDQEGIIQYVSGHLSVSDIQSTIGGLLATPVIDNSGNAPDFRLYDNYPNPFNPKTTIKFVINRVQKINLNIFDTQGRLITSLIDRQLYPGKYEVKWNGKNINNQTVASGIYFYQLRGKDHIIVKKMQFLK
jgi:hypothetical protein